MVVSTKPVRHAPPEPLRHVRPILLIYFLPATFEGAGDVAFLTVRQTEINLARNSIVGRLAKLQSQRVAVSESMLRGFAVLFPPQTDFAGRSGIRGEDAPGGFSHRVSFFQAELDQKGKAIGAADGEKPIFVSESLSDKVCPAETAAGGLIRD